MILYLSNVGRDAPGAPPSRDYRSRLRIRSAMTGSEAVNPCKGESVRVTLERHCMLELKNNGRYVGNQKPQ